MAKRLRCEELQAPGDSHRHVGAVRCARRRKGRRGCTHFGEQDRQPLDSGVEADDSRDCESSGTSGRPRHSGADRPAWDGRAARADGPRRAAGPSRTHRPDGADRADWTSGERGAAGAAGAHGRYRRHGPPGSTGPDRTAGPQGPAGPEGPSSPNALAAASGLVAWTADPALVSTTRTDSSGTLHGGSVWLNEGDTINWLAELSPPAGRA